MAWDVHFVLPRLVRFLVALSAFVSLDAPAPLAAQETPDFDRIPAADVEKRIGQIEAEIHRLKDAPDSPTGWKKLRAVEKQLRALEQANREEAGALKEQLRLLEQLPDASRWSAKIDAKQDELWKLRRADRRFVVAEGAEVFEGRHAELKQQAPANTQQLKRLDLNAVEFPTIDGSTSTEPLATVIACRYFDLPYQWIGRQQRLEFDRESAFERDIGIDFGFYKGYLPEPEAELNEYTIRATGSNPQELRLAAIVNNLIVANASTHQSYLNLIIGDSDIGLLARPPSEAELQEAEKLGVSLEVTPCARDAFVFIVNRNNPIRSLTTKQIRDIYSGSIQLWNSVGGPERSITNYEREEESGSQQLMRSLVMKDTPFFRPPNYARGHQLIGRLMSSVFLELTNDREGLAYSVFYYEQYMSGSPRTKLIAVDGVEPTHKSIASGEYPYVTDVFVVTRKGLAEDAPASRLRSWLLAEEGQAVVQESGYVPLAGSRRDQ